MSPKLCRVALYSRCPVGPNVAVSWILWTGCSRNVHFVSCVWPPVIVELSSLLACQCVGLTLRLAGWLWVLVMSTAYRLACWCQFYGMGFTPVWSGAYQDLPLGMLLVDLIWWGSFVVSSCPLRYIVSGGLFGGAPVQGNVRHCLWPAWGYLLGSTEWSVVGSFLCWA